MRRKFLEAGIDPDMKLENGKTILQIVESNVRQAPPDRLKEDMIDVLISATMAFGMNKKKGAH